MAVHLPQAAAFAALLSLAMFTVGMYGKDHCRNISVLPGRLIAGFLFGLAALELVIYMYPGVAAWRSTYAIALLGGTVAIGLVRQVFFRCLETDAFKRRILVVGADTRAARIEALIGDDPACRLVCVGVVPAGDGVAGIRGPDQCWADMPLAEFAREQAVEEIVVALDDRRGAMPVNDLLACKLDGVTVTDSATFWERESGKVALDDLHPSWLIFSDGFVGGRLHSGVKRVFDVAASLFLLVLTLPVIAITMAAIRLESRGPVFYRQQRVGLNGTPFMLLKFRSMRVDAETNGKPKWAAVDDSRLTRIGGFIRKAHIDEIPQFLNVLRGDMSIIGPRPERPFFVEELQRVIPYYDERHRVKPGISGWAQINLPYGASIEDAKEKFQFDLYYIKNYSLFLDLMVLLQTARVVLRPMGAR